MNSAMLSPARPSTALCKPLASGWAAILLLSLCVPATASAQDPATATATATATEYRQLIDQYCVACHNTKFNNANMVLDNLDLNQLSHDAETWERVIRKLRSRAMPPPGSPRPEEATYVTMIA